MLLLPSILAQCLSQIPEDSGIVRFRSQCLLKLGRNFISFHCSFPIPAFLTGIFPLLSGETKTETERDRERDREGGRERESERASERASSLMQTCW